MIAKSENNNEFIELAISVAARMDRHYSRFCDSCLSQLFFELNPIIEKFNHLPYSEAIRRIQNSLQNKATDYYRANFIRHRKRQELRDLDQLCRSSSSNAHLQIDRKTFESLLQERESQVWPVVLKEVSGVVVANEIGVSPQAVSRSKDQLESKAREFFKEYEHDCC